MRARKYAAFIAGLLMLAAANIWLVRPWVYVAILLVFWWNFFWGYYFGKKETLDER